VGSNAGGVMGRSGEFGEDGVEDGEEEVGVVEGHAHGGFDADDGAVEAAFADDELVVFAAFEEGGGEGGGGLAVEDEFDAEDEAGAADAGDDGEFGLEFLKAVDEVVADGFAVGHGVVPEHDVEGGFALSHGEGVAAEGVEVDAARHFFGDGVGGDDGGEREAVADGFGHDDDVGDDTIILEAPEVGAGAAEAGLDFIGDADAAGVAGVGVGVGEVVGRVGDGAADALHGFGDEGGDFATGAELDDVEDFFGVLFAGFGGVVGDGAPDGVGGFQVLEAGHGGDGEFPGVMAGEGHADGVAAVVAVAEGEDVVVAGVEAGHEDGEVVGFGAGVDEVDAVEGIREGGGEGFGVFDDGGVEVAGGGVLDEAGLGGEGGGDFGMAVTDGDGADAAEAVEVAAAGFVEEVLHFAFDGHEGVFVEEEDALVEDGFAAGEEVGFGGAGVGGGGVVKGGEGGGHGSGG
jgi:hypothetical protein